MFVTRFLVVVQGKQHKGQVLLTAAAGPRCTGAAGSRGMKLVDCMTADFLFGAMLHG
jgi:hypothetical protein